MRRADAQMEPLSLENQISMNLPKRELLLLNLVRELPKAYERACAERRRAVGQEGAFQT